MGDVASSAQRVSEHLRSSHPHAHTPSTPTRPHPATVYVKILLSPGLLYEATTFAAEFSIGLPVVQDVRHRSPLEFQFSVGLRFVF